MTQPLTATAPVPTTRTGPARPASGNWPRGRWAQGRWALLVAAGWLAQTALRLWLASGQTLPLISPDEPAYLIAARVMAGRAPGNLSSLALYPSGYPLLFTPLFWFGHFAHDPVAAYRAVLRINAPAGALLLPLAYLAGRRLRLGRGLAYGVATVTALLPAGLFGTEYATADAIFPVLVLAWLLVTHSWLTGGTPRSCYLAAGGSGLLAGYAFAVHARGLAIVAATLIAGFLVWRRYLAPRGTVAVAICGVLVTAVPSWLLNRYLAGRMQPAGQDLPGHGRGAIAVAEAVSGELWRFALGGWGIAALGLVAAGYVLVRGNVTWDMRIMAGLAAGVTLVIAVAAPAVLPVRPGQAWTGGQYLGGMVPALFVPGCAVLLWVDSRMRRSAPVVFTALGLASLAVVVQLTSHVSRAGESAAAAGTTGFLGSTGLHPGERLAIGTGLRQSDWMPQAYQVWWAPLRFFDPATQPPPAGSSVVELAWPDGQPAQASWPRAPAGWHIVAADGPQGWVAWRHAGLPVLS